MTHQSHIVSHIVIHNRSRLSNILYHFYSIHCLCKSYIRHKYHPCPLQDWALLPDRPAVAAGEVLAPRAPRAPPRASPVPQEQRWIPSCQLLPVFFPQKMLEMAKHGGGGGADAADDDDDGDDGDDFLNLLTQWLSASEHGRWIISRWFSFWTLWWKDFSGCC